METGVIVTGLLVLFTGILPFIIFGALSNLRKRRLTQALTRQAESAGVVIKEQEILNRFGIAVDEQATWLCLAKQEGRRYDTFSVNLSAVAACRVVTTTKTEPGYNDAFVIITERVELEFTWKDTASTRTVWELYNLVNDGTILRGEPEFAARWCKTISGYLQPARMVNA